MNQMATARVIFLDHSPAFTGTYPAAINDIDEHVFTKLKLLRIEPSPLCTAHALQCGTPGHGNGKRSR